MSTLKSNDLLAVMNNLIVDLPAPMNLNFLWNFGSLLGLTLMSQLLTGMFLVMHYAPNMDLAFLSIESICSNVNSGWTMSYLRANGAGFFFILVYIHIAKALYYGSFTRPSMHLWFSGMTMFLILMITAFLGYVLPWGSMSFWAATVITNFLTAIPMYGNSLTLWVWGGFSVCNATLNSFLSLHYLFPFILSALVVIRIVLLHKFGSNNPSGLASSFDKILFHPFYTTKDALGIALFLLVIGFFVFYLPDTLGRPDNYVKADSLVTPASIVPEFYLLFAYAILKSIPNKLGGMLGLMASIVVLFFMPLFRTSQISSNKFKPLSSKMFWLFMSNFFLLTYLGALRAEPPYIMMTQISTMSYFSYFSIILIILGWLENKAFNFY